MSTDFKETDMFMPIKKYFLNNGYKVNAEVKNCDLTATKDHELIIVEIKKAFNLKLLYQAIDRQRMSETVFIAIPRAKSKQYKEFTKIIHIAKKLDLGLLTVAMDSPIKTVDVHLLPGKSSVIQNNRKRNALAKELSGRNIDINTGGSTRHKILTAFREKSIYIACVLEKEETYTAAGLIKNYHFDQTVGSILRNNTYGWFERRKRGVYGLSEKGAESLADSEFAEVTQYYRLLVKTRPSL